MELSHCFVFGAHSGCNSRLSSIASNATSRLSTERRAGPTTLGPTIEVPIERRANSRPICSGCEARPGYDRLPLRRFEFVPLWQIAVFFVYALRRVDCPTLRRDGRACSLGDGKSQLTTTYQWFLAGWAQRLSWKEVAAIPHHLGTRSRLSTSCGSVGRVAPRFVGRRGDRRRRDPVAAGPSLSHAGLSDRRGLPAVMDRTGADRTNPAREAETEYRWWMG